MKNITKYIALFALATGFIACGKMDATYDEFLKGETIYVGRADSVKVRAGFNRVRVDFALKGDPKITLVKLYWNNRADSIIQPITRSAGIDSIKIVVNRNLREGPNNFELFTFDKEGNKSVKVEATGNMYSSIYQSEIYNRGMAAFPTFYPIGTTIPWFPAQKGEVRTELTYTTTANTTKTVWLKASETSQILNDIKNSSNYSYSTLYLPEPTAIDTFRVASTVTGKFPIFDRQLDKTKFKEYKLPTDVATGFGWVMTRLWDNTLGGNNSYATDGSSGLNRWFTFDLGESTKLNRYRVWQATDRPYRDQNLVTWEIWGTDNPAADGSFTGWTKLMDCRAIKPSGTAVGTVTQADTDFMNAGQEFVFPDGLPTVRYIRIKTLTTYSNNTFGVFGEMTFWAKAQ